mmetsp:Transcript_59351/g.133255  ORF Transcript_59351/g.133255 Transcript_59351/m.133255 type:complete len:198 (+) Transcript_59351:1-594(+)
MRVRLKTRFGRKGSSAPGKMQNVTALGPQNHFQVNLLSALGVMHFTDEEMKETWVEMLGPDGTVPRERVFELLKRAYGFEPMPEEMGLFVTNLSLDEPDREEITWTEFEVALSCIREKLSSISKNATEYASHEDLRVDRFKHSRYRLHPTDKFKGPMTDAMNIGWHEEEVTNDHFQKKTCAETRYADNLLASKWDGR